MSKGWGRLFEDPIKVDGRSPATLLDAGEYISSLPKNDHAAPEWQTAMEALIVVAEGGGPTTELQNEKSTDDQIALCRAYAARHQLDVVATFAEKARSGASVFDRDGLMQLMDAARQQRFTVVIVEALDRLSRDMEDLAGIHKRLSFQGIEIQAVHDGTADSILIGIRGLVRQMQAKTERRRSVAAWPV